MKRFKFKKGDKIKCVDLPNKRSQLNIHDTYTIYDISMSYDNIYITNNNTNEDVGGWHSKRFVRYVNLLPEDLFKL